MDHLSFAIKMELDGEKYYREQAEKNKENQLYPVFVALADDEKKHADILQKKAQGLAYELASSETINQFKNVFEELDDYADEINETPDQLDVYRTAMEKERESIDLYTKMLSETADEKEKNLFNFLIKQEEEHYAMFDEIVIHLNRVKEWVESAEFGRREEY